MKERKSDLRVEGRKKEMKKKMGKKKEESRVIVS